MATDVHIDFRVSKPWLWLALFFERIARFCENRALRPRAVKAGRQ